MLRVKTHACCAFPETNVRTFQMATKQHASCNTLNFGGSEAYDGAVGVHNLSKTGWHKLVPCAPTLFKI